MDKSASLGWQAARRSTSSLGGTPARHPVHVIFLHGPAASGKHTIGSKLSALTGLPLFHNHLAVDAAKSLFAFGTSGFKSVRAAVWRTGFREAAAAQSSFIFTFHPEATVELSLIDELVESVQAVGGRVFFVELVCSPETVLRRLAEPSRTKFGKLTDPLLYQELEMQGAFVFPPLPAPFLRIHTDNNAPDTVAREIACAVQAVNHDA